MADTILHDGIEFRTLDGWPGYAVSACGTVASNRPKNGKGPLVAWRLLAGCVASYGYRQVALCNGNGRLRRELVHRLVLLAWVGPCPAGMECRHLNGDPADNRVGNLKWGTAMENVTDRGRHGTSARGSRHGLAKLTEADIPVIRKLLQSGKTQRAIARQFGVSSVAIHFIGRGKTWSHV